MTAKRKTSWRPAPLTPWQTELLTKMYGARGRNLTVAAIGRANGRRRADKFALFAAVMVFGQHVHVLAVDGLWCVNKTDLGPLWERLVTPGVATVMPRAEYL